MLLSVDRRYSKMAYDFYAKNVIAQTPSRFNTF